MIEPNTVARLRQRFLTDARAILRLGGPLLVNNVSIAGMGFTDTVMAGRLSAQDLAAVAVGSAFHIFFYLAGLGTLMAMSPLVAHAYGAGQGERVGPLARQALWLSQIIALTLIVPMLFVKPILVAIGIAPEIVPKAQGFVYAICCGLPAIMAFLALRFVSEGIGWTRPIMFTAIVGLVSNVIGCYVFMYGKLGFPALGAVGTGVSNALVMWIMFAVMLSYVRRHRVVPAARTVRAFRLAGRPRYCARSSRSGCPSAALCSRRRAVRGGRLHHGHDGSHSRGCAPDRTQLRSADVHDPAFTAFGDDDPCRPRAGSRGLRGADASRALSGSRCVAASWPVSALVILFFGEQIAALYTADPAVRTLAAGLLLMAAIFQISDGLQVGGAGRCAASRTHAYRCC